MTWTGWGVSAAMPGTHRRSSVSSMRVIFRARLAHLISFLVFHIFYNYLIYNFQLSRCYFNVLHFPVLSSSPTTFSIFPSSKSPWDFFILNRINADCHVFVGLFQNKYRAKGIEAFKEYSVVTDTPVYETAKQNAENLSDVSDSKNVWTVLAYYCLYFLT